MTRRGELTPGLCQTFRPDGAQTLGWFAELTSLRSAALPHHPTRVRPESVSASTLYPSDESSGCRLVLPLTNQRQLRICRVAPSMIPLEPHATSVIGLRHVRRGVSDTVSAPRAPPPLPIQASSALRDTGKALLLLPRFAG